jgi:hypothetical protein
LEIPCWSLRISNLQLAQYSLVRHASTDHSGLPDEKSGLPDYFQVAGHRPKFTKENTKMTKSFTIAFAAVTLGVAAIPASAQVPEIVFNLVAQPKFLLCLGVPGGQEPTAQIIVQRGELNDILILHAQHLKPNLGFDLFTIQNTNLLSSGAVDPAFKNFGLAWYQTDVQADSEGNAEVAIKTILLDQIFGFDPAAALVPTHTFHVGFWFNKPEDAAACGFNVAQPTPFNGEQNAGPNAMISVPDPTTDLGPLCTTSHKVGSAFVCTE